MNNQLICYDLEVVPDGLSIDNLLYLAKETGYLVYSSFQARRNGNPKPYPYMLNSEEKETKILLDISTPDGKTIYEKIIKKIK